MTETPKCPYCGAEIRMNETGGEQDVPIQKRFGAEE